MKIPKSFSRLSLVNIFALTMVALLSACGGDSTSPAPSPSPAPTPTPAPSPSPTPTPTPAPSWALIFEDNFETIDPANWGFEVNCFGGGNNERQCYTSRADNAYAEDGMLHIVAKEESFNGPALQDEDPDYNPEDTSQNRAYTSARLRSKDLFDFRYGRVEIRAQLPGGQGSWPALWMLPTDFVYGGWPLSGEIDIMEAVNLDTGAANEVHGTLHYGMAWPKWSAHGEAYPSSDSFTDDFHVYALEWEADEIRWYVDGEHYQTQRSSDWYSYTWQGQDVGFTAPSPQAPYDQEFHLLMNLAVGGDWPGAPDTGWTEDRHFIVDYVRVYQCDGGEADGTGCATIDESVILNTDAAGPQTESFPLYVDALQTIEAGDGTIPLVMNAWQLNDGNLSISESDIGGDHATVLELDFSGLANVFFTVGDMGEALEDALSLQGGTAWSEHGVLSFDMLVESIDAETQLLAKMDSAYPNVGQFEIEPTALGEWQRVHIRIADLVDNPIEGGSGLSTASVVNAFVLESSGAASLQLDNIELSCAVNPTAQSWQSDRECSIGTVSNTSVEVPLDGDVLDIFSEEISYWNIGVCCGGVEADVVADAIDLDHGQVVQFSYTTDTTVTFFQSVNALDLTDWVGGTVEFDLYIESEPVDAAWMMKVDCGHPCSTGDVPLTDNMDAVVPTLGEWQSYRFDIDDLIERGLDITSVDTPLVIFPAWGNQNGAVFRVDNIRFVRASP